MPKEKKDYWFELWAFCLERGMKPKDDRTGEEDVIAFVKKQAKRRIRNNIVICLRDGI